MPFNTVLVLQNLENLECKMLKKEKKTKEMSLLPCWLAGYIKRDVSSNLTNEH